MRELITDKDFILNPKNAFGEKLPLFYPLDDTKYKEQRGCMNYGIFLATQLANRRFSSVINAIKDVVENKEGSMERLRQIYNEYEG